MSVTGVSLGEGTHYRVGNSPEATVGLASCGVGEASPEAGQLVADRGQTGSSGSVSVLVAIRTTRERSGSDSVTLSPAVAARSSPPMYPLPVLLR